MKHHGAHGSTSRQFLFELRCPHSQAGTRNLHVNAGGGPAVAEHEGQTHHALVADGSDLGRLAVGHGIHQRADPGLDEINKFDRLVSAVERLPVLQRHTVKMRAKPLVIPRRQQTKQSVGRRVRSLTASRHLAAALRHARPDPRLPR